MLLRSGNKLPQAGTGANRDGESRLEALTSSSPTYSGGDNVSQLSNQLRTGKIYNKKLSSPHYSSSSSSSIFPSVPSTNPYSHSSSYSTTSNILPEDVVQETNQVDYLAPTTDSRKTRRKWSKEMNKFILRTYLQLTLMETDTNGYLPLLHTKFIEHFPEMQTISRQRVGDQRRAVINKNLLAQSEIDQIYRETREELKNMQNHTHMRNPSTSNTEHINEITTQPQNSLIHTNNDPQIINTNRTNQRMRWTKDHNETVI